jgi:hypothetical protein
MTQAVKRQHHLKVIEKLPTYNFADCSHSMRACLPAGLGTAIRPKWHSGLSTRRLDLGKLQQVAGQGGDVPSGHAR